MRWPVPAAAPAGARLRGPVRRHDDRVGAQRCRRSSALRHRARLRGVLRARGPPRRTLDRAGPSVLPDRAHRPPSRLPCRGRVRQRCGLRPGHRAVSARRAGATRPIDLRRRAARRRPRPPLAACSADRRASARGALPAPRVMPARPGSSPRRGGRGARRRPLRRVDDGARSPRRRGDQAPVARGPIESLAQAPGGIALPWAAAAPPRRRRRQTASEGASRLQPADASSGPAARPRITAAAAQPAARRISVARASALSSVPRRVAPTQRR